MFIFQTFYDLDSSSSLCLLLLCFWSSKKYCKLPLGTLIAMKITKKRQKKMKKLWIWENHLALGQE